MELDIFEQEAKDQLSYHETQDYSLYEPRFQQIVKWISQLTKLYQDMNSILDIFSNWGYFINYASQRFPCLEVNGLDISPTRVKYCKDKGQTIIEGDIRILEPTKIYDIAVFSDNLGYFPNPVGIAKKVAKWGMYVIFTTPIFESGDIQKQLDGGLWKSYIQPDDHYEIAAHIGKMVDYSIITCPVHETKWTCSLVKVRDY